MSITKSNLSQHAYNYDMVVAVTQKALNNTMATYYSNVATTKPFTMQTCYYVKDSNGNPVAIDQASLLAQTGGIDPLQVTSTQTAQIAALNKTRFYFAFQFIPGDPTYSNKYNYVEIHPGSDSVTYYLLCTKLTTAFWNADAQSWINITQTTKRSDNPTAFNINANINLTTILNNANLPPAVQAQVNNLGNTDLDVQQLIFDFDSAVVNSTSTVPGLDNNCSVFKPLMQAFATAYFNAYAAAWVPVLNYSLTQKNPASLIPTAMDLYAGGVVDNNGNIISSNLTVEEQDLATLNYLFSVNGEAIPAPAQFKWNWLDIYKSGVDSDGDSNADVNKFRGAISINRDAFAKYIISSLDGYVAQNCWAAYINQEYGDLDFTLGTPPANPFEPYNPNAIAGGEPDQLCVYFYDKIFKLPVPESVSENDYMTVQCYFALMVNINDAYTLTLIQSFRVQIDEYITDVTNQSAGPQHYSGAPVYKTYTDVFNLGVTAQGNIAFNNNPNASSVKDQSTDVNSPYDWGWDDTDYFIEQLAAKSFTEVPFTFPSQFVFPGGDAFTYKDAQFTQYSDLVCHITYQSEQ